MFKPHGSWQYTIEAPVIYIKISGCFNREGVLGFVKDVQTAISALPVGTIEQAVIHLAEFELATADSLTIAREYFRGVKERGYKQVDYISTSAIAKSILESVWSGSGMNINFYSTAHNYLADYPDRVYVKNWL
ncbi:MULTISPECIES: hypothetical protein [unclassified Pseudoalteromonas]|uniref:hypothetical protein n=1 Tax=unclassified Pseudoalteromonas TaxID=194690 RepID=UPI000C089B7E|nr:MULTISPECIES: hypothetical protein [unclassified Pseudoalteromonas]MDP2633533.1 hypothetical protein [Pseudoalteromonas sp. 1_MG-2023]PHN90447.1 hypothetical protein CSC79_07040 [Pseudoalteromonas sp. 3D05]